MRIPVRMEQIIITRAATGRVEANAAQVRSRSWLRPPRRPSPRLAPLSALEDSPLRRYDIALHEHWPIGQNRTRYDQGELMKESGKFLLRMGLSLTLAVGIVGMLVAQDKKAEAPKKDPAPSDSKSKEEKGKDKAMALGSKGELAVVETNLGTMKIKFFPDAAPKAVENFLGLAQKGYYNGLIFHRVIDRFMIQGGDPTGTGSGGESLWGKDFEDEFSPKYRFNKKGLLAMANRGPRTNGSQFFITLVPTPYLNDKHTIFGEVIEGLDVVDKIGKVKTGAQDRPVDPVKMVKVTVELPKAKPEDEKKKG